MKKSILQRMAYAENRETPALEEDAAGSASQVKRHSSPVISNVGKAISQLNEESIIALDPRKIDRSPFQDRFDDDVDAAEALEALKQSIASEGQKIPVLVRPHLKKAGHYQLAYGRRRLAAIRSMMEESDRPETFKIKAYVRNLSDRQLIEEQSVENGVRENLTWIEQAMWAVQLKKAGLTHRNICPILGLSEAGVSQLFRVTSAIPEDIIYAIGRAKSVGRPKWTALSELMKDEKNVVRARSVLNSNEFKASDGQGRIALVMQALHEKRPIEDLSSHYEPQKFAMDDRVFGYTKRSLKGITVTIPNEEIAFADWLFAQMPNLIHEFSRNSELQLNEVSKRSEE